MQTLPDHLAVMAKTGDTWAMWQLDVIHGRFLDSMSNRFRSVAQSHEKQDLRQLATVCMYELLKGWDSERIAFFSYLYRWLPLRMRRELDGTDTIVRVPTNRAKDMRKQYAETGKSTCVYAVPLEKPSEDGEGLDLLDEVEELGVQDDHERRDLIRFSLMLVDKLPPREAQVVRLVTLQEMTFQAAGQVLSCTRQHVQQVHIRAIKRLQSMAANRGAI